MEVNRGNILKSEHSEQSEMSQRCLLLGDLRRTHCICLLRDKSQWWGQKGAEEGQGAKDKRSEYIHSFKKFG